MRLSVIIVHYNTQELTLRCIDSLKQVIDFEYEIIVVDNASSDNAKAVLLEKHPDLIWITNEKNEGFGRANNLGAQKAQGKHLLLLNSDMFVPAGVIEECLEVIEQDENIGVLGPKLTNEDGSFQKSTYYDSATQKELWKQNLILDKFVTFKEDSLDAVMGSFLLISKELFDKVEGFDPDFFMYCEEIDLCLKVKKQGKLIYYFEKVSAIHKHGASSTNSLRRIRQIYLSRFLLVYKQKGVFQAYLSLWVFFINTLSNSLVIWRFEKKFRQSFWLSQRAFYSNIISYFRIPFLYSRKRGNGQHLLKL